MMKTSERKVLQRITRGHPAGTIDVRSTVPIWLSRTCIEETITHDKQPKLTPSSRNIYPCLPFLHRIDEDEMRRCQVQGASRREGRLGQVPVLPVIKTLQQTDIFDLSRKKKLFYTILQETPTPGQSRQGAPASHHPGLFKHVRYWRPLPRLTWSGHT